MTSLFILLSLVTFSKAAFDLDRLWSSLEMAPKSDQKGLSVMTREEWEALMGMNVFSDYLSEFHGLEFVQSGLVEFSAKYLLRPEARNVYSSMEYVPARVKVMIGSNQNWVDQMKGVAQNMATLTCNRISVGGGGFWYKDYPRRSLSENLKIDPNFQEPEYEMGENVMEDDIIGHHTGHGIAGSQYFQSFYEMSFASMPLQAHGGQNVFFGVLVLANYDGHLFRHSLDQILQDQSLDKNVMMTLKMNTLYQLTKLGEDMQLRSVLFNDNFVNYMGYQMRQSDIKPLLLMNFGIAGNLQQFNGSPAALNEAQNFLGMLQNYYQLNALDKLPQSSVAAKVMADWQGLYNVQSPNQRPAINAFEYQLTNYYKHDTQFNFMGGKMSQNK